MDPPKLLKKTSESITLTWQKLNADEEGNRKVLSYNLEWTDGNKKPPGMQIFEEHKKSHTFYGLTAGNSYKFRIQARNVCGTGTYSDTVDYRTIGCPPAPSTPTVTLRHDDVLVQWKMPQNLKVQKLDPPVIEYRVLFRSSIGDFVEITEYCNGAS